ncbi:MULTISPECIES: MFS transporter [unclassified Pseudonocardia]|uniref:MFS transporter n=1 Tax=unclassified Pseudonocardia TaxID=2619320 RepID=UPI00143B6CFD|nr:MULTISPECIES: MFS transporter [unclassified Pseudonocardia]
MRVVTTSAATNLSDGILRLALPLLAIRSGASPFEVSLLVGALLAPWLLGSLLAGVVIDRSRKSSLIRASNAIRAVVLAGLLVGVVMTSAAPPLPLLLTVALMCGFSEIFSDLSAQSAVPQIVSDERLDSVYGRVSVVQNTSNTLVGPALGGLLFNWSPPMALVFVIVSYLSAVAIFPTTPASERRATRGVAAFAKEVGGGLAAIRADSWLVRAVTAVGAMNFASGASLAVLVSYAVSAEGLRLSSVEYGLLLGCSGVGSVLGGLLVSGVIKRTGATAAVMIGALALTVNIGAPSVSTNPFVIGALMLLCSAAGMLFAIQVISARQRRVPADLRGRVNAAFQLVGLGSAPLGAIAGGAAASLVGQRPIFILFAAAAATIVLIARPWRLNEVPAPNVETIADESR